MVIRLTLDVNVWFNNYWSFAHGKTGSAAQQLVKICFDGSCRLGEIQPIISHQMLDTLQAVLVRQGFSERRAGAARDAVEAAATGGVLRISPIVVSVWAPMESRTSCSSTAWGCPTGWS